MKQNRISLIILLAIAVTIVSCSKSHMNDTGTARKFRFQLYTNQDFSSNTSTIHFSIFVNDGNTVLLDSNLATMQIKDIPNAANKIVIEKTVNVTNDVDLSAGFLYQIDGVGTSWYIDTSRAGNPLKVIDYAFQ